MAGFGEPGEHNIHPLLRGDGGTGENGLVQGGIEETTRVEERVDAMEVEVATQVVMVLVKNYITESSWNGKCYSCMGAFRTVTLNRPAQASPSYTL